MSEISWDLFHEQVSACTMCPLHATVTNKVPGQGDIHSPLMLIGEGPGQREDEEGIAFVGAAGQLLTKMLSAIYLPRDRVYICNVVKCRPPNNRVPTEEEMQACMLHLRMQVALVRPKVIVLLGSTALKATLGPNHYITHERGRWYERKGVWMMPTYHPSALLRDPEKKRDAWADMQSLRDRLMDLSLYPDIYQQTSSPDI
ncbi:MAG: uracil-DNA glycosylase [Clostridia bacterium]|jgi:DNA polymerase|nr:uracil-DNA glycosylase [Clostridia bacterium]MBQ9289029.1 uracil-DNA glycosylase [Clostridia bacterium]MBR0216620.1 uracil-DNA glycosylase [Clostridia bacterium]